MQNHQNATILNKGNHSLQQDENLREALRQEEAALPQMPADLNDRLMKRLHHERRQRHFAVWPWVAAACVAAVVAVLLPSRESRDEAMTGSGELQTRTSSLATGQDSRISLQETKDMASPTTVQDSRMTNPDTHNRRTAKTIGREAELETKTPRLLTHPSSPVAKVHPEEHGETTRKAEELLAQGKTTDMSQEVTAIDEMASADLPRVQAKPQQVVLTERDIPISRPENYRYTPEEIALMRRQANEAYVKWMELELEIMNYQYEQVAKQ
jgi:hypothetical protein